MIDSIFTDTKSPVDRRRFGRLETRGLFRLVTATVRLQLRLTLRNVEDWIRPFFMPLYGIIAMAILVHSGRSDMAGYALTASLLFTIGDMGFFLGSEIVAQDRSRQMLELLVATPASYATILMTRTLVVASFGLIGFAEGWAIARGVFNVPVPLYHPWVLGAALLATVFAAGATAVLTASLFSLARSTRTLQNAVNGPFYLLGGVLVPVTFLPLWLQPLSPFVFFYWSARLVRESLQAAPPTDVVFRLFVLVLLGAAGATIGFLVLGRMLDHLRRNGRLGLT
jgi:ABC-2 type transport system permease protein